jgi:hypothetical protein
MDIMQQLRTWTPDKDQGQTDFDDLQRGHFSAPKNTGMIRIVEGADDLQVSINRADRNAGYVTIPPLVDSVTGEVDHEICNNPRCCPDAGPEMMRDRQGGLVWYLTTKKLRPINPDAADAADEWFATNRDKLTKDQASEWIDRLKIKIAEGPVVSKTVGTPAPIKTNAWGTWRKLAAELVRVGGQHGARFAVDTENGAVNELAFWWIVKNDNGPNGTRYFIRQVIGGQGAVRVRMSPEAMVAIARKIEAAGPVQAMLRYGQEIGSCGHCGRDLTNDKSRAFGMGPKCRKDKGM